MKINGDRDENGRFVPGNGAAIGHKPGGGRPPRPFRAAIIEHSNWALAELRRIASDPSHELHREWRFPALVALARITTPRTRPLLVPPRIEVEAEEPEANGPVLDLDRLLRSRE